MPFFSRAVVWWWVPLVGACANAPGGPPADEPPAGGPVTPTGPGEPGDPPDPPDPTDPATGSPDWPDLPELDAEILEIMDADHVPGVGACIVVDGEVGWCNGYGHADLEAGRPVTPDTPFLVASVSKTVVAVGLARAWQDGRLDLDAPVNDVLPFDVVHPGAPGVPITPRMLAAHVSGIRDDWSTLDPLYTPGADCPVALDAFLEGYFVPGGEYYAAQRNFLPTDPGARSVYSNVGAALAAFVVQHAVGEPFDAWSRDTIFAPLGMTSATWFLADSDESTLAMPYAWRGDHFEPLGQFGFVDWPSGQLRASAVDMARFLAAFQSDGGGVIEPATNEELFRIQFPDVAPRQGLIWYSWTVDGAEVWGHDGSEWGSAAEIAAWRDAGVGTVVLLNVEARISTIRRIEAAMHAAALAL